MEMTTSKTHATINCESSSSLDSLTIVNDEIVVARFKSNPEVTYVYTLPTKGALAKLVEFDSAGKFVASYVKPFASVTHKVTAEAPAVVL